LSGNILKKKDREMDFMNYEFCDGVTHTVKKGDTLYEISRMHNVPLAMLLRANPYVDVFNLQVGDTICVPTGNRQMMPYPVNGREYMDVGKTQERSNASPAEDSGNSGRGSVAGVFDMAGDTPDSDRGGYGTTMPASSGSNVTDTSGMPSGRNPESASEMLPVPFENSTEGQSGIMVVPSEGSAGNVSGMPSVPSGGNTGNALGMPSALSGDSTGNIPSMPYTGGMVSMSGNNGTGRSTEETAGSSAGRGRGYFNQDDDDGDDDCEKSWEKYVVMPGDTLADVLANMKGDVEDFLEKNKPDTIYMLPGVAYYICK